MSKCVVITKRVKDLDKVTHLHFGLPDDFPVECKEYDSFQEAMTAHWNIGPRDLMLEETYKAEQRNNEQVYAKMFRVLRWWHWTYWWG